MANKKITYFSDFLMSSSEVSCQLRIQEVTPSSKNIIQHIIYDTTATCTVNFAFSKEKTNKITCELALEVLKGRFPCAKLR